MGGERIGLAETRSEFLPIGIEDTIRYQRRGGCFVATWKAALFVASSILLATCVGVIVYYLAPCLKATQNDALSDVAESSLNSMDSYSGVNIEAISTIEQNIKPLYYRLRMQPYLDETTPSKFTFDGHVSIILQTYASPTSVIKLHVKNLTIEDSDIIVSYSTTSKIASLVSESQVKEEGNETRVDNNVESNTTINSTNSVQAVDLNSTISTNIDIPVTVTPEPNVTTSEDSTALPNAPTPSTTPLSNSSSTPSTTSIANTTTSTTTTEEPVILIATKNTIKVTGHEYDEILEQYTINLELPLEIGVNYTLDIPFKGILSEKHRGFIRSKYSDVKTGGTSWLVTTLLKPTFARAAFPCFDDPSLKAKFEISIARQTSMIALSNMPLRDTTPLENTQGWVWDHFQMTPPMSTYLVSMTVSSFIPNIAPSNALGTVINIWGRKGVIKKATYALDLAPKLIKFYNSYFKYRYPLAKIDLVAVPDLLEQSVESWGVIYLRESTALVDNESSIEEKETLLKTLGQKLAAQWFGNLVTMKSWKDVWVTEGLSGYLRYMGLKNTENTWDMYNEYILNSMQSVLAEDGFSFTNKLDNVSITHQNDDPDDIYSKKSSCIIGMLSKSLNASNFMDGTRMYIEDWKYKNFEPDNIWDELAQNDTITEDVTVGRFMDTWKNQEGYPIVTVTRDYLTGSAKVNQNCKTPHNHSWILPITYMTENDTQSTAKTVWLTQKTNPITIDEVSDIGNSSWVLFNVEQTSLCRVNYDEINWRLLINVLQNQPETFDPVTRAMLLDDSFHLARSGLIKYEIPLEMSLYLMDKEEHYLPWATALKNFKYLDSILCKSTNYGHLQDYVLKIISNIYTKLSTNVSDEDSHTTLKLRSLIVHWACKYNNRNCKKWAYKEYQTWANFSNPDEVNSISNTLRSTVYCVGIQMQSKDAFEFLSSRFQLAKHSNDEANALIQGMSCATDSWILLKYLDKSLNHSDISPQNSIKMWSSLSNDHAVNVAFEYLRENWSNIYKSYTDVDYVLSHIIRNILSKLSNKSNADEVKTFFKTNSQELKPFSRDVSLAIKRIEEKYKWTEKYMTNVSKWLQNQH